MNRPSRVVAAALAILVSGCSTAGSATGPSGSGQPSGPAGPPLVVPVSSAAHLYSANLPAGWTGDIAPDTASPDTLAGPEGAITVRVSAIPPGISDDAWIDTYLDERSADFPAGCLSGGGAPREPIAVGSEHGALLTLGCLPGWLLVVAADGRLYDLRFKDRAGSPSPAGKAIFEAIAASIAFVPGTLASPGGGSSPSPAPAAS